jgi:hypothetical protein
MLNNCNTEEILTRIDIFDFNARNKESEIYSFPGIPSDGIEIKIFDMNKNMQVIEVRAFASAVRYYNRYYTDNGNVVYIESITQEWDLEKLHGKNAELEFGQGEFVVKTSTREEYIVKDNALCKYIAMKPREKSAATTASSPTEDLDSLLNIYNELKTKLNF